MLTASDLEPRGFRLVKRIPAPKTIDLKAGVTRMLLRSGLQVDRELLRDHEEFAFPLSSHLSPEYLLLERAVRTSPRDLTLLYRVNRFDWPSLRQSVSLFRSDIPELKPYRDKPVLNQGVHRVADGRLRALTFVTNEFLAHAAKVFDVGSDGHWPAHFQFIAVPKFARNSGE